MPVDESQRTTHDYLWGTVIDAESHLVAVGPKMTPLSGEPILVGCDWSDLNDMQQVLMLHLGVQMIVLGGSNGTGGLFDITQRGVEIMTSPSPGETVSKHITFDTPYLEPPVIQVTVWTSVPQNCTASYSHPAIDGFDLYFNRTSTADTSVAWTAIGR